MQTMWVQSLIKELDPTRLRATEPTLQLKAPACHSEDLIVQLRLSK